ncbi:MAG: hypothetical protein ACK4L4_17135 [Gemmobacter sp.]
MPPPAKPAPAVSPDRPDRSLTLTDSTLPALTPNDTGADAAAGFWSDLLDLPAMALQALAEPGLGLQRWFDRLVGAR